MLFVYNHPQSPGPSEAVSKVRECAAPFRCSRTPARPPKTILLRAAHRPIGDVVCSVAKRRYMSAPPALRRLLKHFTVVTMRPMESSPAGNFTLLLLSLCLDFEATSMNHPHSFSLALAIHLPTILRRERRLRIGWNSGFSINSSITGVDIRNPSVEKRVAPRQPKSVHEAWARDDVNGWTDRPSSTTISQCRNVVPVGNSILRNESERNAFAPHQTPF